MKVGIMKEVIMILIIIMMETTAFESGRNKITVVNGGYENVVFALSTELDSSFCDSYIREIIDMVKSSSRLLYSATGYRMFFSTVTILIPDNWQSCYFYSIDPAVGLTFEDAHVRIHDSHPLFQANPWTEQPRGCGEPGNFIYLSDKFLLDDISQFGSLGAVFVHEWAKFRWGVFEEYGHSEDTIYPTVFHYQGPELHPNYCADGVVYGTFSGCYWDGFEEKCDFDPSSYQNGLTSSLLAVPFTDMVRRFCTEENHFKEALTKHNFMCNKKSTWEVISNHADIVSTSPGSSSYSHTTEYTIRYASPAEKDVKLVFAIDVSRKIGEGRNTWDYLRDSVRQFIKGKAAKDSKVGIILFTDHCMNLPAKLVTLDSQEKREALAATVPIQATDFVNKTIIGEGLSCAAELLGDVGKIILVSGNMESYRVEGPWDLIDKADGLAIQPILYPDGYSSPTYPFYVVAQFSGMKVQTVENTITSSGQSFLSLVSLTEYIELAGRPSLFRVASESTSCNSSRPICGLSLNVHSYSNDEAQFLIEVLIVQTGLIGYPNITVVDPDGADLTNYTLEKSTQIYFGSKLKTGVYSVKGQFGSGTLEMMASILSFGKEPKQKIEVSTSKPLDQLEFLRDTVPVIYAKLTEGYGSIVFAQVNATVRSITPSNVVKEITLSLQDNGLGADVTGHDGIYSSYLYGVSELGRLSIFVTATDNGRAQLVNASSTTRTAPVDSNDLDRACCGSSLDLPNDVLEMTGDFLVNSSTGINGKAVGVIAANYPPGRVSDLRATRRSTYVTLSFTATGENFNTGRAFYTLNYGRGTSKNLTDYEPAGTVIDIHEYNIKCDILYVFTIVARDREGLHSQPSNEVRMFIPCQEYPFSGGVIAGIVIGCVVFVILLGMFSSYLYKNRTNLNALELGQFWTCRWCKKQPNDNSTSPNIGRANERPQLARGNSNVYTVPEPIYYSLSRRN